MSDKENPTTNLVLGLVAAGAMLAVAVVAPGVPGAMLKLGRQFKKYDKRRLRQVVKRLSRQELISFRQEGRDTVVTLSEKGRARTLRFDVDNLKIKEPDAWDEKWRIVLFDIPESKKLARDAFRRKLKELGFYQFQKSAFIYPFECRNEIDFVRSIYEINDYTKYLIAEELEDEEFFKGWFGVE